MELEKDGKLPFLDILISKNTNYLGTSVYRKPTNTNVYLKEHSYHPESIKLGIIKSIFDRALSICDNENTDREIEQNRNIFKDNGFDDNQIHRCLQRALRGRRNKTSENRENKKYVSLPYVKGLSEKISRTLSKHNIIVAHKSNRTIKDILCHPKDKITEEEKKGIIYKVNCLCGKSYIGETGRPLSTRMKEHRKAVVNGELNKSAIAEHCYKCGQQIDWANAMAIGHESDFWRRKIKESIKIKCYGTGPNSGINRDNGFEIGHAWDSIIKDKLIPLVH